MTARSLTLTLAGGLLYLGPLLGGLSGAPLATLPVFAAAFLIWIMMLRPALWSLPAEGAMAGLALRFAGTVLAQILLVAAAFAVGRGLGMLMDGTLALPVWLPLAMSLAALPIARLVWSPAEEKAGMADFLDAEIARMEEMAARLRREAATVPNPFATTGASGAEAAPATRPPADTAADDAAPSAVPATAPAAIRAAARTPFLVPAARAANGAARPAADAADMAARLSEFETLVKRRMAMESDVADLVRALVREPDADKVLQELFARREESPMWQAAFLEFLGHPETRLSVSDHAVADWLAEALVGSDTRHLDEALAMAQGWIGKRGFAPADAARLAQLAQARLPHEAGLRAMLLRHLIGRLVPAA